MNNHNNNNQHLVYAKHEARGAIMQYKIKQKRWVLRDDLNDDRDCCGRS